MGMYGQDPKSADAVRTILREALFEVDNFAQSAWKDARKIEHDAYEDLTEEPTIGNAVGMARLSAYEREAFFKYDEVTALGRRLLHAFGELAQIEEAIAKHDEERESRKNGTADTPLVPKDDE